MKNKSFKLKQIMIYVFPLFAIILCLFAKETSHVAKSAIYLCLDIIIPSLFPFFVLSKIIIPYISLFPCPKFIKRFIERFFYLPYYTIFIILLGFISGYPNGAKMTRDMLDQKLLDNRQATKLLPIANNCSPLFFIGTIGAGLFKSIKLGVFLLLIHWVSGLIAALITGKLSNSFDLSKINKSFHHTRDARGSRQEFNKKEIEHTILTDLFTSSIEDAAILCIKVSGYIVFFAVISELLSLLGVFSLLGGFFSLIFTGSSKTAGFSEFIAAFIKGIMEITSGAQAIYNLNSMQLNTQLAVISIIFGFAGFSVHTQIMGIMKGTGCKYRVFFFGKLLHGILAGVLAFLTIHIMPMSIQASEIEALPSINILWTRPVIIGILIISLAISPYRATTKVERRP